MLVVFWSEGVLAESATADQIRLVGHKLCVGHLSTSALVGETIYQF
jgi:hypothetical protein